LKDRELDLSEYFGDLKVAICKGKPLYLESPPFNPHLRYPEYIFEQEVSSEHNSSYDGVRTCLHLLGLDKEKVGSREWNPFKEIIRRGDKVVIKPNFVVSSHSEKGYLFSIITHPSVLRAVVDYVYKAIDGEGEIIIADAPQMDCNFETLLEETKLPSIQDLYWSKLKFEIKVLDLRDFWLDKRREDNEALSKRRKNLPGDPLGSLVVNLGEESNFFGVRNWNRLYGADFNRTETIKHHHGLTQEYSISRTVLTADVVVSVPKLKVHKKVGVTLNAKGLVGINTNKNYLVHYTLGSPEEGGDQFPSAMLSLKEKVIFKFRRVLYDVLLSKKTEAFDSVYMSLLKSYQKLLVPILGPISKEKKILDCGNWFGNDSAWRMVSDLITIVMFADKNGRLRKYPQRRVFSIIDGIVGGENNGPLIPNVRKTGIIIAGFNPLATDIVGTRLMGFDWRKVKFITNCLRNEHFSFHIKNTNNIEIVANRSELRNMFQTNDRMLNFKPPVGWRGHIELFQK